MSPLPAELTELMHDTVTLEPKTGTDKYNKDTYGAAVEVDCYIVRENKRVVNRSGEEVTSTVQVILADPDLVVDPDDRLTLPDGSRPTIIGINGAKDEDGNNYWLEIRA